MSNAATAGFIRDRDLFFHDGRHLRRFRLTVRVQAALFALLFALTAWSSYATARFFTAGQEPAVSVPTDIASLTAATELRARQIEQRQEVLAAMLAGEPVDPASLPATTALAPLPAELAGRFARIEQANIDQARAATEALDARYAATVQALKKRGVDPQRFTGMGGPLEPATGGDATFKALFTSWKKLDNLADGAIAVPSDKPVTSAAFTSGYGVRSDPFKGRAAMHAGIDLAGPVGTPIHATADATVLRAGYNSGGYGNLVELDHGKGITTRYGHMSKILVSEGQHVTRGQVIGLMGSTGRSTGSHLHYEVRIDGRAVNPIPFMKSNDYLMAMKNKGGDDSMDAVALGGPQR